MYTIFSLISNYVSKNIDFVVKTCFVNKTRCNVSAHRCPDNLKIKEKMLISSSESAVKQPLTGLPKTLQWTDISDIQPTIDEFRKTLTK